MQLGCIQEHPSENGDGLADDVLGRTKQSCSLLRHPSERIVSERAMWLGMVRMLPLTHGFARIVRGHDSCGFSTLRPVPLRIESLSDPH